MKKILNQEKNLLTCAHIHMHPFYFYIGSWTILNIAYICVNGFCTVQHKTPWSESRNRKISVIEAKSSVREPLELLVLARTENSISRQTPNNCPASCNTCSFAGVSRISLCLTMIWGLTNKIQSKKITGNKAEQYRKGLFATLIPQRALWAQLQLHFPLTYIQFWRLNSECLNWSNQCVQLRSSIYPPSCIQL